jgi:hypothetical protein
MKRTVALIFLFLGAFLAIVQWWQIGYRLHLYYVAYKSEPYLNHIGGFTPIYVANVFLLLTSAFSFCVLRSEKAWRHLVLVVGIVNLAGWIAFFLMHRTGILVEYPEFIRHMKEIN